MKLTEFIERLNSLKDALPFDPDVVLHVRDGTLTHFEPAAAESAFAVQVDHDYWRPAKNDGNEPDAKIVVSIF